jgi:hypothetical protein
MPKFTASAWEDIGNDVLMRRVFCDGELYAVEYQHPCTHAPPGTSDFVPVRLGPATGPVSEASWLVEQDAPLTLSPSLLCTACKHHGFIRSGKWVSV